MKVTKDMLIREVVSKYPDTRQVFEKHGLHCFGCPAASGETVEHVATLYSLDLDEFLKELNEKV